MSKKVVCSKHERAFLEQDGCPYCAPEKAVASATTEPATEAVDWSTEDDCAVAAAFANPDWLFLQTITITSKVG